MFKFLILNFFLNYGWVGQKKLQKTSYSKIHFFKEEKNPKWSLPISLSCICCSLLSVNLVSLANLHTCCEMEKKNPQLTKLQAGSQEKPLKLPELGEHWPKIPASFEALLCSPVYRVFRCLEIKVWSGLVGQNKLEKKINIFRH